MKKPFPTIRTISLFVLAITLFVIARIAPVPEAYSLGAPHPNAVGAATASPTSSSLIEATNTPTPLVAFPTPSAGSSLLAFIEAPPGALALPYVTITAFQAGTYSTDLSINGTINSTDFTCPGSPCTIPVQLGEWQFTFHAQTSTGLVGDTVYATVLAELRSDGYHVTIESVSQFARAFQDACLTSWGITDETSPAWAAFPQFPYQLNTDIPLHHLAARLITYGVVDTKDCPAGGLSADMDWPNACGLERAHDQMVIWQNQFDSAIWASGNDLGIPPKILKTLIEVESQFWPGNERFYVDEFGLGQVNQLGVDVLLRNDYNLYQQVCPAVLSNCTVPYVSLPANQQAQVRGALMASMDTTCKTCTFGIDLSKAQQSIKIVAQLLRSDCDQAKTVIEARSTAPDYESYWKFTLLTYHSGSACLEQAVKNTKLAGEPVDWEHVVRRSRARAGASMLITSGANLGLFDSYRYASGATPVVQHSPVFSPTCTPQPSPTAVISTANALVTVFVDSNGDGTPQPGEGLDGIPVQMIFPDGKVLASTTHAGQATFDLSGYVTGTQITATLPNLYRNYRFYLPQSGTVSIVFTFAQPTLPGKLP